MQLYRLFLGPSDLVYAGLAETTPIALESRSFYYIFIVISGYFWNDYPSCSFTVINPFGRPLSAFSAYSQFVR